MTSITPPTSPPASRALRGQGELLAHVPYQLGVTPTDSVVVVGFDEHDLLIVTLRLDPPEPDHLAAVEQVFSTGRLSRLAHAAVVLTGPGDDVFCGALVVRDALARNGIAVSHMHRVDYAVRAWQTDLCRCGHCPTDWVDLPEAHRIGAVLDAAVRGIDPSGSRADLERRCLPTEAEERIATAVGLHPAPPAQQPGLTGLAAVVDPAAPLTTDPEVLSAATASMRDVAVRDGLLNWCLPEVFPPTLPLGALFGPDVPVAPQPHERPEAVSRLVRWACRVPERDAVPIWACIAALEWARGGGPLATIALDNALEAEPDYSLALLVRRCLMGGVMPFIPGEPPEEA